MVGSIRRDSIWRGGSLLAFAMPSSTHHVHLDHLGSPRLVTDEAGTTLAYHAYFPFGEEATDPTQDAERAKFTGHERDFHPPNPPIDLNDPLDKVALGNVSDDLDYLHARYFSPHLGRFFSVDPVTRYAAVKTPQLYNRYAYALGNPLKFVDPDGEETQLVVGGHTENNVFGHVAIAIDGTVYSFGTRYVGSSGDWGVSLGAYLNAQNSKRSTTLMTLDLSPEQESELRTMLETNDPRQQPYSVLNNSCVTACEQALESVGVLPNDPGPEFTDSAGNQLQAQPPKSFTPAGLAAQVQGAGLVTSSSTQGQQKVSKLKALWNTITGAFERFRE